MRRPTAHHVIKVAAVKVIHSAKRFNVICDVLMHNLRQETQPLCAQFCSTDFLVIEFCKQTILEDASDDQPQKSNTHTCQEAKEGEHNV
mmetsp:Transcript_15441/g.27303  ORF Transcript_15441/g.27303 Transcript_15441/m.27303 type:complete len:89 (-) Transcript_15441:1331-1597(-)